MNWGLIIGCSLAGVLLLVILIYIIYRVYKYYQWRNWLEKNQIEKEIPKYKDPYQYPVTDKYSQFDIGIKGRRF